ALAHRGFGRSSSDRRDRRDPLSLAPAGNRARLGRRGVVLRHLRISDHAHPARSARARALPTDLLRAPRATDSAPVLLRADHQRGDGTLAWAIDRLVAGAVLSDLCPELRPADLILDESGHSSHVAHLDARGRGAVLLAVAAQLEVVSPHHAVVIETEEVVASAGDQSELQLTFGHCDLLMREIRSPVPHHATS